MTVRVWMPGAKSAVNVRLNSETRPVIRLLSRSTGSYIARSEAQAQALTPHIVK